MEINAQRDARLRGWIKSSRGAIRRNRPRAGRFEAHQLQKWLVAVAGAEVVFAHTEAAEVFEREVNAAASGVFANVAQDVGELESHAAFLGQRQSAAGIEAEDMDDGQADDRGDLVAVAVELVEGFEAARLQVGDHAIDHFAEVLVRNAEAPDGVMEGRPDAGAR